MSQSQPSPEFVLYVWPGRWDLPSIDPWCIAAVFHLQLTLPGKFSVAECTNPDLSPSGQLPYMIHEQQVISPLSSIIKYIANLKGGVEKNSSLSLNLDAALDPLEKSQKVAWCAHVESNLGDLVSHMLYSLHENWSQLVHPTFASILPIPQRYYIPGRVRDSYRPRLEAAGLWGLPGIEQEDKKPLREHIKPSNELNKTDKFLRVFEREKVLEKAQSSLDIYARLLGAKPFFYRDRPTTLDIILAAHILLLLHPPFPDPLLKTLLTSSYPTLVEHARLVHARAQSSSPENPTFPARSYSLWSLVPQSGVKKGRKEDSRVKSQEDIQFERMRWAWIALAVGSVAVYLSKLRIRIGPFDIGSGMDAQEGEMGAGEPTQDFE